MNDEMYVSTWEDECEFNECDEDGYCWMEVCGDKHDICNRYSCTLWKYDQRQDYWDFEECPEEEQWFNADAVWEHVQPYIDIYHQAALDELEHYCPDGACIDEATEMFRSIANDTLHDEIDLDDIAWEIDNLLGDDVVVDVVQ